LHLARSLATTLYVNVTQVTISITVSRLLSQSESRIGLDADRGYTGAPSSSRAG
jgi:hypothetical protein